jgi:hypothetical protein
MLLAIAYLPLIILSADVNGLRWLMAFTMFWVVFHAVGFGPAGTYQPELIYLPLSRQARWRVNWVVSTVAPVAQIALLKVLVIIAIVWWRPAAAAAAQTMAISILLDFSQAQLAFAINWTTAGRLSRAMNVPASLVSLPKALGIMSLGAWPLVVHGSLPVSWAQVTLAHWVAVVVAIGSGLIALSFAPNGTYPARIRPLANHTANANAAQTRRISPARAVLSLVRRDLTFALIILASFMIVLAVIMMKLSSGHPEADALVGTTMYVLIAALSVAPSPIGTRSALRFLRVLPLSTSQLAAIVSVRPLAIWTIAWALQEAVRFAAPWLLPPVPPGLFAAIAGITSLEDAATFRWASRAWIIGTLLNMGVVITAIMMLEPGQSVDFRWLGYSIGLVGVCGSFLSIRHALARASSTYKPFRLSLPGALAITTDSLQLPR